jgi:catechol 2,3-dioxygenase-like lactoylglutathione lyase family enzyme
MTFNHAMVYVSDVARAADFYAGVLGFIVIEDMISHGYARLKSPDSDTTIALHGLSEGNRPDAPGIRLYFEVEHLDEFCHGLEARGVRLKQPPRDMPWGWRHAYLDDPDGHEVSLYWAGEQRVRPRAEGL